MRYIDGDRQIIEVWANGQRRVEAAPLSPYYYTTHPNPARLHRQKIAGVTEEDVRPLSDFTKTERWRRVECATVEGVSETHAWETGTPNRYAENHLGFLERVMVDSPEWFRERPNSEPLRLLTFDLEQAVTGLGMPARSNPLCSVAWALDVEGQPPAPVEWVPASIGSDGSIDDRPVVRSLLEAIRLGNPDLLVGYNVHGYDLPVLMATMRRHRMDLDVLCRMGSPRVETVKIAGSRKGERDDVILRGRTVFDVWEGVRLDQTLFGIKDRKLKTVAEYLGLPVLKLDGARPQDLLRDNPEKLRAYNVNDVELTRTIGAGHFRNAVALAELMGAPLNTILRATPNFFQSIIQARAFLGMKPRIISDGKNIERYRAMYADPACPPGKPVTGAFVSIEKTGRFTPIWKADFSSLYPSIIIALGLGSDNTRWLGHESPGPFRMERDGDARIYSIPDDGWNRNHLVRVEGVSPFSREIANLRTLRYAKKRERVRIEKEYGKDHSDAKNLWAEENALKVVLNALYGVEAGGSGRYASLAVGLTITGVGRYLATSLAAFLGKSVVEVDTDGLYLDVEPDKEAINRELQRIAHGMGVTDPDVLSMDVDRYDAGYFVGRKTYLLLRGNRVDRHGQAFKASSRPKMHDKVIEDLGLVVLRDGLDAARARAPQWENLRAFEPKDFVMRLQIGKSEYIGNTLGAQLVALAARDGIKILVGDQVEYVRTRRGLELAHVADWRGRIDEDYYLGLIQDAIKSLGIEKKKSQGSLDEFFSTPPAPPISCPCGASVQAKHFTGMCPSCGELIA